MRDAGAEIRREAEIARTVSWRGTRGVVRPAVGGQGGDEMGDSVMFSEIVVNAFDEETSDAKSQRLLLARAISTCLGWVVENGRSDRHDSCTSKELGLGTDSIQLLHFLVS